MWVEFLKKLSNVKALKNTRICRPAVYSIC